ncbi:NifU family protein [Aureitalea marina]|uniref:Scaffold protein Nfu/NifU N-terminal domain-containing protein n=1 Tax=Aureitalea marina TaxID=930804 RepID=A0A2S7KR96_9FLAO|nr:NifU family protein [Aureitalea marina]PQB05127.1 hypothetical protein BST85_09675 [Aureitalea marina]
MKDQGIQIQPTSNPSIVKFVTDRFLTQAESFEFGNIDEAKPSPLTQQLFYLPFVKTVYISQNFVAIEKFDIVQWEDVQEEVADAISDYLESGQAVVNTDQAPKKIPVTVYAESTPNPGVMKFVANKPLVDGTFEFKNIEEAVHAPLAKELFGFPFVKEVFISSNYVSVARYNVVEWEEVIMELREFIRSYLEKGKEILSDAALAQKPETGVNGSTPSSQREYSDIDQEIMAILDEYVKPAVAGDGGHIAFDSFDPNTQTVRVILQGACSGCPSSTVTLKNGIETMLREMMQGRVNHVEAING